MIRLLLFCSLLGLVSSTVYLMLVLRAARRFRREFREEPHNRHTRHFVTVFKPLHGMEPMLERNLESFFRQDYPEFELIFGARHSEDPALKTVDALRRKYPQVKTTIVLSGEPEYPNAKVFALEKMVRAAAGSYCADDYVLGNLAYKSGKEIVLSHHFIDHVATNTSVRSSLMHQV